MSGGRLMLVTGSSGLVGSACVRHFAALGWSVHGLDNNLRRTYFGADGDTTGTLDALRRDVVRFTPHSLDLRDRPNIADLVECLHPDAVIHCAAQPSHDWARERPFEDFDVNAQGTLTLLEAVRRNCPDSPFVFLSTNKVYGDAPNGKRLVELDTRWEYAYDEDRGGIDETCSIDGSLHSLFGVSKAAADLMVQEYGREFDMPTVCFRCGCLTGSAHAAAEQHGFLAYMARCVREGRSYRIYGYKGKQVRDNLHASDVCRAAEAFLARPKVGAVYNLGGGRANAISLHEAADVLTHLMGKPLDTQYVDAPRRGDHVVYISDTRRFASEYAWSPRVSLACILADLAGGTSA